MGKHEVGTPKYIANKIKAKGLQKLRWYCQMCQKQCRDENGFKCHTMSESHQRQLLLFADNADSYIDEFSKEFLEGYLELLHRQFGTKRVPANRVYQEYIANREHIHMNATKWETLTEFVKWLGREGKCVVDETEKGWFVAYIDRDPEAIALMEKMEKKEKMDRDDQEKMMDFIDKQVWGQDHSCHSFLGRYTMSVSVALMALVNFFIQIQRGRDIGSSSNHEPTELVRSEESEVIKLNLSLKKKADQSKPASSKEFALPLPKKFKGDPETSSTSGSTSSKSKSTEKKKQSALDEIIKEEERRKENAHRKPNWLTEGIVVKVVTKSLGDKYYNEKGRVLSLVDKFTAVVQMISSKTKIKIDQSHLETVIPAVGRLVRVVNGAYRGNTAVLKDIKTEKFCATIVINSGPLNGRTITGVDYEDISKLHTE